PTDFAFWQTRSPQERLNTLLSIRSDYHQNQSMLNTDFLDFLALLNQHQVHYLIVGGYAVAVHGHPRYTKDIDIWLEISPENAQNLLRALAAFGFGSLGLTETDFLSSDRVIQLGYPPNRIDLLTSIDGVEFGECYGDRLQVEMQGLTLPFIDLDSLRRNKQASGRFQDLADLENLQ
ncbi:MAG: DUF6036 family nucleotidyltransferase, partial [Prochlorothrix sp.]|nr:DUF6036 family nucleotidyltransferase [Prochlorothrix sp.]